jgi:hypothetical protein
MAANGISELSTKLARQTAKLDIAQLKRRGYSTIVQNTTAYSAGGGVFSFGQIKITVNNVDDVYLHFYDSVPAISNQLKVGMIVTIDWDGRAPNTVAYIASTLIDFPGHAWRPQGLGFLLTIITTTELPGNSEDYNIDALHVPNGTFAGSGSPDTTKAFYRLNNTYDLTLLPDTYATTGDDNPNTGGLVQGRPWTAVASIRALLSGAGQTAYDAASSDAFFAVSSTDYNAVVAGVASTSTVGPSDAQFTGTTGNAFSSGYIITYPQANATVPANNYIIGFRATTDYSNQQWRIYGGPTFKSTSPVYSQIATTSPATSGTGTFYYLRKAPTVQAATTYIGIYGTQTLTQTANAVGFWVGGGYTSGAFTTWSNFNNNMPKVQVLITPTAVT